MDYEVVNKYADRPCRHAASSTRRWPIWGHWFSSAGGAANQRKAVEELLPWWAMWTGRGMYG
ncbi:MAG: hypothetical protein ACLVEX_15180 [Ruthenibacterium lactatiformans]